MSKAGSGRYTRYVPVDSPRNRLLRELFNKRAGDSANLYGGHDQTNNIDAANAALVRAKDNSTGLSPASGLQKGDPEMFPEGVHLDYSGIGVEGNVSPPKPSDVVWKKGGDPIGAFMPDISSPGPGITDGTLKADPGITQEEAYTDVKGKPFVPDSNTLSPAASSEKIAKKLTLGSSLEKGKI